ncbi:MAG: aminotransferase class IV [Chloroflexi bacterium]|nr:aminotransferase class IV [Chloroflexota bacterium]
MSAAAWVDGAVVPRDEARVSIDDFAVRYGAACFETMLARGGRVFRLDAYLDRLEAGLRGMGVTPPARAELAHAIAETLAANALTEASVRLAVTAGRGPAPDLARAATPGVIVTADPVPPPALPPRLRVVATRVDARRPLAGAKTAQFLPYLLARAEARATGADDALLLNHEGAVVEAATANIFLLRAGGLETPPLVDGPLPGVTRAAVIEVARGLGIPVVERTLTLHDVALAEAVLLTSSVAGIVAAASVVARRPEAVLHLDWQAQDPAPALLERLREAYAGLVRVLPDA